MLTKFIARFGWEEEHMGRWTFLEGQGEAEWSGDTLRYTQTPRATRQQGAHQGQNRKPQTAQNSKCSHTAPMRPSIHSSGARGLPVGDYEVWREGSLLNSLLLLVVIVFHS
jgi:hypothetical protein